MAFWNKVCLTLKYTFTITNLFEFLMLCSDHLSHFKDRKSRPKEVEGPVLSGMLAG